LEKKGRKSLTMPGLKKRAAPMEGEDNSTRRRGGTRPGVEKKQRHKEHRGGGEKEVKKGLPWVRTAVRRVRAL